MSQDTSTTTATILVIDDEPSVTGSIQAILSKEGYRVHVASEGRAGVDLAIGTRPDLIILDITMPGLDGYQTAELIKRTPELTRIPIIFLTGKSADEDGGLAFAKGGVTFVRKPFSGKQLKDLVTLAIQSLRP